MKSLTLNGVTFMQDGAITKGAVTRVAKLRCNRSELLDRREYRYVLGTEGRLAVLTLEEDDRRIEYARLDAQCPAGDGPRFWKVLLAKQKCPALEP